MPALRVLAVAFIATIFHPAYVLAGGVVILANRWDPQPPQAPREIGPSPKSARVLRRALEDARKELRNV